MALYGDLTFDSRVQREARSLADAGYDVLLTCLAWRSESSDLPPAVTVSVVRPAAGSVVPGSTNPFFGLAGGRIEAARGRLAWLFGYVRAVRAWGRAAVAATGDVDVWHAHDLTALVAVMRHVPSAVPVVYDSHELFLETGTALRLPGPVRRLLRAYERRLVARVALVVTVNEGLASVLRRRYRPKLVSAVHNCPDRWTPPTRRPTLLRDAAGIASDAPVLLYHGALSANRGIEQAMAALLEPGLEDAHLVLLGFGEMRHEYVRASSEARWRGRVHVLDPVTPVELLAWVASADIGVMPIQPTTLNHRLSTPNKLFECLAAGVPVIASDFPAVRQIVLDDPAGRLGAVCDPERVDALAEAILALLRLDSDKMMALRARCLRAGAKRWNWEREAETLISAYSTIIRRSGSERGSR